MGIAKNTIIERYLDSSTLRECAKLLIEAKGVKKDIYQEIFTLKLLEKAISNLEPNQLMRILRAKENSIYGHFANQSYVEMLFDVEEEILEEVKRKIKLDNE